MAIVHVVLFRFKADAKPEDVKAVRISNYATSNGLMGHPIYSDRAILQACERFLALKGGCVHPTSNSPYILSLKGGKDNSPEGLQVRSALCPCPRPLHVDCAND